MSNAVITASQKLKMTEADLFRSAFKHKGIEETERWREAYTLWCERDELPREGYNQWFLGMCLDVINGKLVLYPVVDLIDPKQLKLDDLVEVKPGFEDDDGN